MGFFMKDYKFFKWNLKENEREVRDLKYQYDTRTVSGIAKTAWLYDV